jgi:hypothetical protein
VRTYGEGCFEKQRTIDALTEENKQLRAKLKSLERKEQQGYFGSSTPSSKVPLKVNPPPENQRKQGGAKKGHTGHGRQDFDESQADHSVALESEAGANTRSILMAALHTLKKQNSDPCTILKTVLDQLANNPAFDPFPLLFPSNTS